MRNLIPATAAAIAAVALSAGVVAAATIPIKCQVAKTKEAGSLSKCLQTAQGKLVSSGDTAKYAEAAAKCLAKFNDKWTGAEQKATDKGGACQTTGDQASVIASVQANIACITQALQTGVKTCLTCGNGVIDAGEDCDLGTLGAATCSTATDGDKPNGTLNCGGDCAFNTSACAAGAAVGGFDWYLSSVDGASCDSVCGVHGLVYDTATLTYAGSAGTDGNCAAVLAGLGHPGGVFATNLTFGLGCAYYPSLGSGIIGVRDTTATTSSGSVPASIGLYRACACH